MSEKATDRVPNIFPGLKYRDAPAAIAWLGKTLGFSTKLEVPNPDGTIAHAELQIGPGLVMLGSRRDPPMPGNPWDTVDQGIYVAVDEVDAHYDRAKAAGAEIVRELADTDYGSREYSVRDSEGYLWSFGTYRP